MTLLYKTEVRVISPSKFRLKGLSRRNSQGFNTEVANVVAEISLRPLRMFAV